MPDDKLKSLIAPTAEVRQKRLETFKQYASYGVITLIIIITVFIVPIIAGGITADDWSYWIPDDTFGWICWWAMKIGTVIGNLAVFALFKAQGKTNARDNPNYIKAKDLLAKKNGEKGFVPKSPAQYQAKTWTTKGISVFLLTGAETVVIGSLIVSWDLMTFISCIVSSITAIIFGIVQMIKDEVYWTDEYLLYAEYITKQESQIEKEENACLSTETKSLETCKNKLTGSQNKTVSSEESSQTYPSTESNLLDM